jgi:hypothetical protein
MTIGKPLPPRTAIMPNNARPHPGPAPASPRREPKTLTVGRDITLSGEISSCDRLVVEGEVRSSLEGCQSLEISGDGAFRGKAKIATAEIAGLFEGELDVEDCLYQGSLIKTHSTGFPCPLVRRGSRRGAGTTSGAQRRERSREAGLRWGFAALRVRCGP